MKNEVFLNDQGIVETVYHGDQTADSVQAVVDAYRQFLGKGSKDFLIDVSDVGRTNVGARVIAVRGLRELGFHKMASYGANIYLRSLINFVIRAIGKKDAIKYCETREQAMAWIKGKGD